MNQYQNSLEYYNYVNNNYNKPMYQEDINASKLYDPYQGLIRGNMFKELYNDYKMSNPIMLDPKNEQEDMKLYLDSLCFAAHDINLYLDLYPDDKDMLKKFADYRKELEAVKKKYEEMYGPIFVNSESNTVFPWTWDNSPWPWEGV